MSTSQSSYLFLPGRSGPSTSGDDGGNKNLQTRTDNTTQQSLNQQQDRRESSVKPELIEDVCEEYSMFGTYIPKIDAELDARLESMEPKGIPNGFEIKVDGDVTYQIDKPLGRYSYRVKQVGQKRWYWLKIQRKDQPKQGPFLRNTCNYMVMQLTNTNLADARKELKDIDRALATRLALQSLQAIHDIHLCHFIHRDIRPENFHVGLGSRAHLLFIANFDFAFRYFGRPKPKKDKGAPKPLMPRRLPKLPWLSMKYQSRSYHRVTDVHRCDDLESWLYMCVDFFDQSLPW
ncbi:CK1/TTBK protein kinase, partial [Aphelenchoides avenae]